jgi:ribonuclease HII
MSARPAFVLAGIDEAGLGPLLGSLALGYSALEVHEGEPDPWKRLRGTVAKAPGKRARLVVADSKIVFQRNAIGARRLEKTALSFLTQLAPGREPLRSSERLLYGTLAPEPALRAMPWIAHLPPLPCDCEAESIELSAALLARALERAGLRLVDAGVRMVPRRRAQRVLRRHEQQGALGVGARGRGAGARVGAAAHGPGARHGRHARRAPALRLAARARLPRADVRLVEETRLSATYSLGARDGSGSMELEFRVQGERHSFPVALASCLAKYARELEMRAFNAYFATLQPELKPTAGYRNDGHRWLRDAEVALERSGLAREVYVRER